MQTQNTGAEAAGYRAIPRDEGTRRMLRLLAAMAIAATGFVAAASPAGASVRSGNVHCYADHQNVVGVWVEVSGGGSGWAQWSGNTASSSTWWKYDVPAGRSYRLHVGCGGTRSSWASNTKCAWTTKTSSSNWTIVYAYGSRICRAS